MRVPLCFFLAVPAGFAAEAVTLGAAYEVLAPASNSVGRSGRPSGIGGRVLCGYQGWFRAEGDGSGLGFAHYEKRGRFEPGRCSVDLWPDLAEFDDDEKYRTAFRHDDGRVAHVFSSLNPKTVDRHFRWMRDFEIDGVFVQRFATLGAKEQRSYRQLRADNQKLLLCRDAANRHGRCYALMYDLSGLDDDDFERLARDWKQLRTRMELGTDPNDRAYLQVNGRPLVAIWGVGFDAIDDEQKRAYSLEKSAWLIRLLKHNPDWGGMSVMLGVPYGWREQVRDATKDRGLHEVLALADVISPWSVGRYRRHDIESGKVVGTQIIDRAWCAERRIEYLPVLFPGFSWRNLHGGELGAVPREGGRFFWEQFIAAKAAGNSAAYIAMFDEIDEGTAVFKCTNDPPAGASPFLTYEGRPSDHYLWLCREGRLLLRGGLPRR